MTISVVQAITNNGNPPAAFSGNVTAGNTVFLAAAAYSTAGGNTTSSAVKLGGSTVPGTIAFFNPGTTAGINSASSGGNIAYITIWMLPNCPGGQKSVGVTISGNTGGQNIGQCLWEVSGLGASPVLDKSNSGSSIATTSVASGTSGAITTAPEFVLGAAMMFGGSGSGASGFTSQSPAVDLWGGYQIPTSSGGSYNWQQTSAVAIWSAAIVTVQATAVVTGGGPFNVTTTPAVIQSAPASSSPGIQGQAILTSLSGSVYLGGGTAVSSTNGAQVSSGGVPLTIPLFGSDSIYAVASSGTVTASILPGGN